MQPERGFYLVFEGLVGCGKTTQSKLVESQLRIDFPNIEIIWTKEPGGTEIANAIRTVVQGTPFLEDMDPVCEQFLYAASRAQSTRKVVTPVVNRGGVVISDRSVFTSMVNQGYGRKMGLEKVLEINGPAVAIWPDKVIYVKTNLDTALARAKDGFNDKFELLGKEFHSSVAMGYEEIALIYPRIVCTVDGDGDVEDVFSRIYPMVFGWIKNLRNK